MMCFLAAPMAQQLDFGCISMYEIQGKKQTIGRSWEFVHTFTWNNYIMLLWMLSCKHVK